MYKPGDIIYHKPSGTRGQVLEWDEWWPKMRMEWGDKTGEPERSAYDIYVLIELDHPISLGGNQSYQMWAFLRQDLKIIESLEKRVASLIPRFLELMHAP